MKRLYALPIAVLILIGLTQMATAGPERLLSGKEMKEVAPAPAPECNWTGFYIGLEGGYGGGNLKWTVQDQKTFPETTIIEHQQEGFFGGGELGYNFQIGRFVVGAEGDFSYSDVTAHTSMNQFTPDKTTNDTGSDWIGTIALRLGLAWRHALFFAKGGVSFAHLEYLSNRDDFSDPEETPHIDRFSTDTINGAPMVGGGVEYALNCHWSVKAEYKHIFFGNYHIHGTTFDLVPEQDFFKIRLQNNAVELGLNYKF